MLPFVGVERGRADAPVGGGGGVNWFFDNGKG